MFNCVQFLIYKLVPAKKSGKTDKIPCSPYTLEFGVNPLASVNWTDFNHAKSVADLAGPDYGVGFVFTKDDPYFFIDIDGALDSTGRWSQLSVDLCAAFPNAYVEVSQSGTGAHIIGQYSGVAPSHSCKNEPLGLECYTQERFVALTGHQATGDSETNHTNTLLAVIVQYFPPAPELINDDTWMTKPDERWSGPDDDTTLVHKMCSSRSAGSVFGGKASVKDLWENNEQVLAVAYPSDTDTYNRSQADAALAQHLAFWTGNHHERIERLMLDSGLVRDKWDSNRTYIKRTITNAVGKQKDVLAVKKKERELTPVEHVPVPSTPIDTDVNYTTGDQFLTPQLQAEYFKGCVYIRDIHKVYVPDGSFLKPEQFKASYGGFIFSLDALHEKTTKNAWEAFVESQAIRFPKVARPVFRPELQSGAIFEEEGLSALNVYVPISTPRQEGDPSVFLGHLAKVLPDANDREILLSYMAACVQYKGIKFQWCPLIQGAEGNGKTLFTRCVEYAIGQRYSHLPNAQQLGDGGSKFTAWIQNKLFIGVEEIYVSDRREVTEALKVFITNDRIEIQGKGADQIMGDNRANFMMNSNHKDALHVTLDSRRYAVFYSAQQNKKDKVRDGMTGDYFPKLYRWLKNEGGYAIVNEFLHNYQINEQYNPATMCQEAPITSSTEEAVEQSLGSVEHEILEAISEGRIGFKNGWISSKKLDDLLREIRAERKVPINKRREVLERLGYQWHPFLDKGRVNTPIPLEDGVKPKLFIKIGHISMNLKTPAEIVGRYCKDQGYSGFGRLAG